MRKNLAAALSAALVHATAHASIFPNPVDNPSFESPDVGGTFGSVDSGWARGVAAGAFIQHEDSNTNVPETPYGAQWGGVQGTGSYYQQIGTVTADQSIRVSWLAGDRSNRAFNNATVEIWAGGTPIGEGLDAFTEADGQTLESRGAALVGSHLLDNAFADQGGVATEEQQASFNVGSDFSDGEALWLRIAAGDNNGQALIDNVQVQIGLVGSFTATPETRFGSGGVTLDWSTVGAGRLVINDGSSDIATYTATADGQTLLDSGSLVVNDVSTTTVFTLTATVGEDGSGEPNLSEAVVTVYPVDPDLTAVAVPSVAAAPTDVTLHFNAFVLSETGTEVGTGAIDDFFVDDGDPDNGYELGDSLQDFDALLSAGTDYVFRPLSGPIAGQDSRVVGWSGTTIVIADDYGSEFDWLGGYAVFEVGYIGADSLVINDGTSDVFITTDPAVIAGGSFSVGTVAANTTFTVTASNSESEGSTVRILPVVVDSDGGSYEETVLADSPVGYYRLEESAGSSQVYDSSGNGNHSTQISGSPTPGVTGAIGRAIGMNNNESVYVGVNLDPSLTDWTIEGIVRPDFESVNQQQLTLWSNANGTGVGRSDLYLLDGSQEIRSFVGGQSSPDGEGATLYNATPIPNDCWSHAVLTATRDEDDTYTLRFYLDGVLDGEQSGIAPEAADGDWVFGSHKNRNGGQFFNGPMDEMAIYDSALSETRIQAHFNTLLSESDQGLSFIASSNVISPGESVDLIAKVGAAATAASIDNGVAASVPLGAATAYPVSPTSTTTYTLDVDGVQKSVTVTVVAADLVVEDFGLDDGDGNPFLTVSGLVDGTDYQLWRTTDLITDWTAIGPVVPGDATGMATFTDPDDFDAATNPIFLYQVRDVTE